MSLVERGDITELVQTGQFEEGLELEAKAASGSIPRNAWETISAFANTVGGALVLGLEEEPDEWIPLGVGQSARMIQDLHSAIRDPQKISYPVCGHDDIWTETIGAKDLIVIRVRPAARRNKPVFINGNRASAFVRRDQNDARCTVSELERFRREATTESYDAQVLPEFSLNDLDLESVRRYREMAEKARPQLGHHRLDDKEFLQASRAWGRKRIEGTEGPTVAGLLMFGKDSAITEIRSNHVIDYQRIPRTPTPGMRWSDRLWWTGNLFNAWEAIYPRLTKSLPIPFRLRGPQRTDEPSGQDSIREVLVNLLVHTDYKEIGNAVIEDRDDGYLFLNPGDSWVIVEDLGIETHPERRNPCLATLFQNVGLAEQAGSGFITMRADWLGLGYRAPVAHSDPDKYRFSLFLPLSSMIPLGERAWLDSIGEDWSAAEELALLFAHHEGSVDNATLRAASGQHLFDASQTLRSLRDREYLVIHGSGRSASYVLGPKAIASSSDHSDVSSDHWKANSDHSDVSSDHWAPDSDHLSDEEKGALDDQIRGITKPIALRERASSAEMIRTILRICSIRSLSSEEITEFLNRTPITIRRYTTALLTEGKLVPLFEQLNHPRQQYRTHPDYTESYLQSQIQLPTESDER